MNYSVNINEMIMVYRKWLHPQVNLCNGNAPKYWKRSHNFYSFSQENGFENTI
jgi:hypothetical protein